jgi:hypothetical protein
VKKITSKQMLTRRIMKPNMKMVKVKLKNMKIGGRNGGKVWTSVHRRRGSVMEIWAAVSTIK